MVTKEVHIQLSFHRESVDFGLFRPNIGPPGGVRTPRAHVR
jgi:hypothetical protein